MNIRYNGRWRNFEEFHIEYLIFFRHRAVNCIAMAGHFVNLELSHDLIVEKGLLLADLSTNQRSDADGKEVRGNRFHGLFVARLLADLSFSEK